MKTLLSMFLLLLVHLLFYQKEDFKAEQMKYSRVRQAYAQQEAGVRKSLQNKGIRPAQLNMLLVAFKEEKELELWVKNTNSTGYQKLKTYPVCATSGHSGPKQQSGDRQIPEGFYYIDRFNPASTYHLSLGINYPNAADRARSTHANLGGDIFIHGACVTVGCLPLTDPLMEELYVYAVEARNSGQNRIPVYIYPARMDTPAFAILVQKHKGQEDLLHFWDSLKVGYQLFNSRQQELGYTILPGGKYAFPEAHTASQPH